MAKISAVLRPAINRADSVRRELNTWDNNIGVDEIKTPGGTARRILDPNRFRYVFVLGWSNDGYVLFRDAVETSIPNKMSVSLAQPVQKAKPAHGFIQQNFEQFRIDLDESGNPIPGFNGKPDQRAQVCAIVGGRIRPEYRFATAPAVGLEDLCEPSVSTAATTSKQNSCDGCGSRSKSSSARLHRS